jgi:hypothetical protein
MVGRDKGLCTRLIKRAPFALQNHCIAHRLNLAYKDSERDTADDNFEALKDLDSLTRELYSFFKKSPQKCLDLEKFARLKKQPAYKMLKVYDVRWLSKFNAIENIRKNLEALLSLLRNYMNINESDLSSKSASLYKKITNPSIVFLLYILSDVLFDVMTLMKRFQADDYSVLEVEEDLKSLFKRLELEYIEGKSICSIAYKEFVELVHDKKSFCGVMEFYGHQRSRTSVCRR